MRVIEQFTGEFCKDVVPTEAASRELLLEKPLPSQITYLAVPWATLLNESRFGEFRPCHTDGGFTICQHVRYEAIVSTLVECGISVLFTPHVCRKHTEIKVIPYPHVVAHALQPQEKEYLYSFIGFESHPVRREIFKLPKADGACIVERPCWHFAFANRRNRCEREYFDVLAKSRFSLCPRGTGASTIRFWESLQAGAIPVVISDAMQLPEGHDWHRTVIRLAERDVGRVDETIKSIPSGVEEELRRNCLEAYRKYSGQKLVAPIFNYFTSL